jgi:hypothetical protein
MPLTDKLMYMYIILAKMLMICQAGAIMEVQSKALFGLKSFKPFM